MITENIGPVQKKKRGGDTINKIADEHMGNLRRTDQFSGQMQDFYYFKWLAA